MAFSITEERWGTLPALAIVGDGARLVLTLRGATVISWTVDGIDLIDGYADEHEFAEQLGMRSAMMIPFSNRIPGGRYTFDDTEYNLNEHDPSAAGETVLHGLLRLHDFTISEIVAGETSGTVHLVSRALRPGALGGYPFSVDVSITITVRANSIEFVVAGSNVGDSAAPFATGWHPYFRIGNAPIESFIVTVPAAMHIALDADLIPLDGEAAFESADGDYQWRDARELGDRVLDGALGDLTPGADGLIHSTMTDPATGRTIDVWQERGLMHVFTSDTVTRPRQSVAMEPVEVMTNAFGRPEQAANVRLEPGALRSFRFGTTTTMETQ